MAALTRNRAEDTYPTEAHEGVATSSATDAGPDPVGGRPYHSPRVRRAPSVMNSVIALTDALQD